MVVEKSIYEIQALKIIQIVNSYFKLECRENTRQTEFVYPRQLAMYFIDKYSKIKLEEIGKLFGRGHSSVIHSRKVINNIISLQVAYNKEKNKKKKHSI